MANKLHYDEHIINEGKAPNHKAKYYYYMACQLIQDLRKDIQHLSKQYKYLWQTLDEIKEKMERGEK